MAHILTIDDDEVILKVVRATLQRDGHVVVTATEGRAALDRLSQECFDLVICDANLPGGLSGFAVVSSIRRNELWKAVPIMFLTGRRERESVVRAVEAGADDYLVKPIDQDVFLAKVNALLGKRRDSLLEAPLNAPAHWALDLKIVGLSESGLHLQSPVPLALETKLVLEADLFADLGISAPFLKVISCARRSATDSNFAIDVVFLGLSEDEARAIHRWLRGDTDRKVS